MPDSRRTTLGQGDPASPEPAEDGLDSSKRNACGQPAKGEEAMRPGREARGRETVDDGPEWPPAARGS